MGTLVDLTNKDVINYIDKVLALPEEHIWSPYKSIPKDQFDLYKWAKAYEELEPIVTDHVYDMFVRMLQRQQIMFPEAWEEVSLTCFKDGSWAYTGMFIESHDPEDEEWLL